MLKLDLQFFGGRGASSASSGGSGKTQKEHMDKWHEPPSKAVQLMNYLGITPEEAIAEANAVDAWSGIEYGDIRKAQYTGETGTWAAKQAEAIEKFIQQSPKWAGGELYRGINLWQKDALAQLKPGAVIDMRGMSSWSTSETVAKNFAGNVIFKTSGTKKGTSITHLSKFGLSEKEVLISGKATWKIQKVEQSGNYTVVTVKERR